MAEMKHIEDSNENVEETLKSDAEGILKKDIPVDILRHDSGKEELEPKGGVKEAQASNLGSGEYKVMTINMDGNHDRAVEAVQNRQDCRQEIIVNLLRNHDPDVVFCQELPGLFETVLKQLNTGSRQWECEKTDKTAAGVLWDSNLFHGSTDRRMTNIRDQLKLEGKWEVQDLLSRTSFVKLTEINKENPRSFIAVSYHGKYSKTTTEERELMFQDLVLFTQYLCKEEGNIPFLIGGDFNFDTTTIALPGIEFGEYTMTSRSQQEGKIPYKDNFCWERKAPPLLSMTGLRPFDLSQKKKDGFRLDHDPIVGTLAVKPIIKKAQASNLAPGQYRVMTINMDGNHDSAVEFEAVQNREDCRREIIVEFLLNHDPDVVFCQELPGLFDTVLNHGQLDPSRREWESTKTDNEAAVLWNGDRFVGCKEEFQSTHRRMREIRDQLLNEGNGEVQYLLSRTSFVKLTERGPENPRSFIAVSYHGKHNKAENNQMFRGLVQFTQELCKEKGNIPFLIGGGFHFDTTTIALPGIEFGRYAMTPRSQQEGRIPYKDNFCWERKALLSMTGLRPCELSQRNDGFRLDHDPIIGTLLVARNLQRV